MQENASLQDILEFRQAILQLNTAYPFSAAFGPADSRKKCFASASKLYYELLSRQSEKNFLDFRTLCEIAINPDGSIDSMKLKRLVQLLKPNKENAISAVCFTRSVDKVYRELKTLAARIRNASASEFSYHVTSTRHRLCTAMLTISSYLFSS